MFRTSSPQSSLFEVETWCPDILPEDDWCFTYRARVLPLIDEEGFRHLYAQEVGRPNASVKTMLSRDFSTNIETLDGMVISRKRLSQSKPFCGWYRVGQQLIVRTHDGHMRRDRGCGHGVCLVVPGLVEIGIHGQVLHLSSRRSQVEHHQSDNDQQSKSLQATYSTHMRFPSSFRVIPCTPGIATIPRLTPAQQKFVRLLPAVCRSPRNTVSLTDVASIEPFSLENISGLVPEVKGNTEGSDKRTGWCLGKRASS